MYDNTLHLITVHRILFNTNWKRKLNTVRYLFSPQVSLSTTQQGPHWPSSHPSVKWYFCGAILNLKTTEKHFKRRTKPTLCPCHGSTQLCSKIPVPDCFFLQIFWGVHWKERIPGNKVLTQPFQSQPLRGNKVEINRVCLAPVPTARAEPELLITRTGTALGRQSANTSRGYRPDRGLLPPRTTELLGSQTQTHPFRA